MVTTKPIEFKQKEKYVVLNKNWDVKMICYYDYHMYCEVLKENLEVDYKTSYGLDFFNEMIKQDNLKVLTEKDYWFSQGIY